MMGKKQALCNYCGVPEEKWVNGVCYACSPKQHCNVREENIIEQKIYDWFVKKGVVNQGELLLVSEATLYVDQSVSYRNVPQYIKKFINEHRLVEK